MNIPDYSIVSKPGINRSRLKKEYTEFLMYLDKNYPESLGFTEKLYWYFHNLDDTPKCICGNPLKFRNFKIGYSQYCSAKCSNSDPDKIQKTKETCLDRYDATSPAGNNRIKSKIKKTCLERYGESFYSEISHMVGPLTEETKNKMKKTCLERYGVDNVMKLSEYCKKSNENKDYKKIAALAAQSRRNKLIERNPDILAIEDGKWVCKCPHPECTVCTEKSYKITSQMYHDRKKDHTEPCTTLLAPSPNNNKDTSIEIFIRRILDEYNIPYITNNRSILDGKELDIYIPDKQIAIECNGVFSHSTRYKESTYHYKKYKSCQDRGIRLISIWEDWIRNKPGIVKNIILSKLGIYQKKIWARNCIVRHIDSKIANKFLTENHIQGASSAKVHLGLYHNEELVSVMTFGEKRACSGNDKKMGWELVRYCGLPNTTVVGGAGKLLSYFINQYSPDMIFSFSACDISDGNLYKKLHFNKMGHSMSYWYIDERTLKRYHRSTFTKKSLIRRGWSDGTESESNGMERNGFLKIYDSGTEKWILKII